MFLFLLLFPGLSREKEDQFLSSRPEGLDTDCMLEPAGSSDIKDFPRPCQIPDTWDSLGVEALVLKFTELLRQS